MSNRHFLVIPVPAQGHINPALQLAKRLIALVAARITFAVTVSVYRRMAKTRLPDGVSFVIFSDGHDDGLKPGQDTLLYLDELKRRGSETLRDLISKSESEGCPIGCVIYTLLLPWAAEVARQHHIPSAILWTQSASVFDIFYYYFNGYGEVMSRLTALSSSSSSSLIDLPGLQPLARRDVPTFLLPESSVTHPFAIPSFRAQMDALKDATKPRILVNTFDELETEALRAIEKVKLTAIGPLIPSAYLDGEDPSDTTFGGDLLEGSNDYIKFLDSKPGCSVIYVSFGSFLSLSTTQTDEIAKALLECGRPFLWVQRGNENTEEDKDEKKLSGVEKMEKIGMIVPWCSQLEVLSHPSLGCFVSHCGWNSAIESMVSGVPVVAFPVFADQQTNAKLIEDAWKTGVRVSANEEGVVESGEIKKCLEMVMKGGEKSEELRRNAEKWKILGREAVRKGGSSWMNLKSFIDEVDEICGQ